MLWFLLSRLVLVIGLLGATGEVSAQDAWAYLSVFQSGRLIAIDPKSGVIIHSIPVQDSAGIAVIASSDKDGRLFVVDGDLKSRFRILDPNTFSVLQESRFDDRVLRFSNYRLLHISRDGNWLFVYTYRYREALNQIRVFDINQGSFVETELGNLACAEPLLSSARDGTIFALCPGSIQAVVAEPNSRGAFTVQANATVPLSEIAAAAATPDGRHVYALGMAAPRGEWRLIHWDRVTGMLDAHPLAAVLAVPETEIGRTRWTWLGLTSDARELVLVQDSEAWLINRESLKFSTHFKLPSAALGADIVPGDGSLLTVHAAAQDTALNLVTTRLSSGVSHVVPIQTNSANVLPISFAVGPGAPRH